MNAIWPVRRLSCTLNSAPCRCHGCGCGSASLQIFVVDKRHLWQQIDSMKTFSTVQRRQQHGCSHCRSANTQPPGLHGPRELPEPGTLFKAYMQCRLVASRGTTDLERLLRLVSISSGLSAESSVTSAPYHDVSYCILTATQPHARISLPGT